MVPSLVTLHRGRTSTYSGFTLGWNLSLNRAKQSSRPAQTPTQHVTYRVCNVLCGDTCLRQPEVMSGMEIPLRHDISSRLQVRHCFPCYCQQYVITTQHSAKYTVSTCTYHPISADDNRNPLHYQYNYVQPAGYHFWTKMWHHRVFASTSTPATRRRSLDTFAV
jgi:hypothetical protein